MKYLICRTQKGEGCDYTIGCGMAYEFEDFDGSIEEAIAHFAEQISYPGGRDDDFGLEGDHDLSEVWIIPADQARKIDLGALRKAHAATKHTKQIEEKEKKEKSEFERLQKKFAQK